MTSSTLTDSLFPGVGSEILKSEIRDQGIMSYSDTVRGLEGF